MIKSTATSCKWKFNLYHVPYTQWIELITINCGRIHPEDDWKGSNWPLRFYCFCFVRMTTSTAFNAFVDCRETKEQNCTYELHNLPRCCAGGGGDCTEQETMLYIGRWKGWYSLGENCTNLQWQPPHQRPPGRYARSKSRWCCWVRFAATLASQ